MYTHKLNFELDTSVAIFNWLPDGGWLRRVELEGSLDYVASGLPKAGQTMEEPRVLDDASAWSFSLVFVAPVAPFYLWGRNRSSVHSPCRMFGTAARVRRIG